MHTHTHNILLNRLSHYIHSSFPALFVSIQKNEQKQHHHYNRHPQRRFPLNIRQEGGRRRRRKKDCFFSLLLLLLLFGLKTNIMMRSDSRFLSFNSTPLRFPTRFSGSAFPLLFLHSTLVVLFIGFIRD